MATIATQPLIVAKVGLQSSPPPKRQGKPFKTFGEVMAYIIEHEGPISLFKGIGPQILKGLLVQGLLMMTKERYVVTFDLLHTRRMLITNQDRAYFHPSLPVSQATPLRSASKTGHDAGKPRKQSSTCCAQVIYAISGRCFLDTFPPCGFLLLAYM
jgi:hypothetical protein